VVYAVEADHLARVVGAVAYHLRQLGEVCALKADRLGLGVATVYHLHLLGGACALKADHLGQEMEWVYRLLQRGGACALRVDRLGLGEVMVYHPHQPGGVHDSNAARPSQDVAYPPASFLHVIFFRAKCFLLPTKNLLLTALYQYHLRN